MASIFNNVEGLHPKRNSFSADTYRNDFTAPLGVNIPCYIQHVMPATRIKCSASALVRLQALIAPVMDNIDYYVHFWKIPYRLLENDRFTAFISGELDPSDYEGLFLSPKDLGEFVASYITDDDFSEFSDLQPQDKLSLCESIFDNGSLLDFLGYDQSLFPAFQLNSDDEIQSLGGCSVNVNWRGLIAYFMLHLNWYMNENVPYFDSFVEEVNKLYKDQDSSSLCRLLVLSAYVNYNKKPYSSLLPHGWEKDYFTSALPNVQNGDPVTLPMGGSAPVTISPQTLQISNPALGMDDDLFAALGNLTTDGSLGHSTNIIAPTVNPDPGTSPVDALTGITSLLEGETDLSEATAITINELRFANALQVFKERQMRFGRRRLEYYKGFFDVSPEDLRLQVPKYLGGGRVPINISDIEQTSATSGTSALGHLAGKATAVAGGFAGFTTFCSEESIIIGISFAMPHITYANGLSRFLLKTNDIYDYYNPSFQHLGEQAIKNIEVFAGSDDPDGDFGYTPRYTEYRFHSNEMHGEFKSSLAYWSLGRIFSDTPALNAQFIYMQPSVFDRIFAVSGQPNMIVSMLFHVKSIKPLSKYGTPMLLA